MNEDQIQELLAETSVYGSDDEFDDQVTMQQSSTDLEPLPGSPLRKLRRLPTTTLAAIADSVRSRMQADVRKYDR